MLSEVGTVVTLGREERAGRGTGHERPRRDDRYAGVSGSICDGAPHGTPVTYEFIKIPCLSSTAKELDSEMLGIVVRILSTWSFNLQICSPKHPLSQCSMLGSTQP